MLPRILATYDSSHYEIYPANGLAVVSKCAQTRRRFHIQDTETWK